MLAWRRKLAASQNNDCISACFKNWISSLSAAYAYDIHDINDDYHNRNKVEGGFYHKGLAVLWWSCQSLNNISNLTELKISMLVVLSKICYISSINDSCKGTMLRQPCLDKIIQFRMLWVHVIRIACRESSCCFHHLQNKINLAPLPFLIDLTLWKALAQRNPRTRHSNCCKT